VVLIIVLEAFLSNKILLKLKTSNILNVNKK